MGFTGAGRAPAGERRHQDAVRGLDGAEPVGIKQGRHRRKLQAAAWVQPSVGTKRYGEGFAQGRTDLMRRRLEVSHPGDLPLLPSNWVGSVAGLSRLSR